MAQIELPKKEATLFKNILEIIDKVKNKIYNKMYEFKQYKKGLKSSDAILKKFPEHGETLTLKGLFLNHLNRKEEGYELAKKGLEFSLKSSASWHIYGIMNRNDKNYEEALNSFVNALKFDKENFQIIRDICALQIHLRNYDNFNEICQQILDMRPGNRPLWVSLAVSYNLLGKNEAAVRVLDTYDRTFTESPNMVDYEHSEILLYRNQILQEMGDMKRALDDLEAIKDTVFDKQSWKLYKADVLKSLERNIEATEMYRQLINANPDNREYIHGLLECDGLVGDNLPEEDISRIEAIFSDLLRDNPRSNLLTFLPLQYLSGEKFERNAEKYIQIQLRKGVPSLFANLKGLYKDESKKNVLFQIVERSYKSLEKCGRFSESSTTIEPPTAFLWALYFLAQHHDKVGSYPKALDLIEQAISHTPTLVELHMTKAKILKHLGCKDKAMRAMNDARELDLQDRYVNTKCVKYMLRNDQVEEAEKTIILFIRPDCTDKLNELFDNQCLWFTLESAKSFHRTDQLSLALKRCHQLFKNFNDFEDDQFDFHNYCMRKSTLRPYIKMLTFEDNLYSDKSYVGAAEIAVDCYLRLYNNPDEAKNAHNPEYAKMSEAEKSKLRIKHKKFINKIRQAEETAKKSASEKKKDEDLRGDLLMETSDPLSEAYRIIKPLLTIPNISLTTQHSIFEVLLAQGKLVKAIKCLTSAFQLESTNAKNNELLQKFEKRVQSQESLAPILKEALNHQVAQLRSNVISLSNLSIQE